MKLERHSKIVELIGKYEIDTQEELAERLRESGFTVTQATVSRDIRELKLTKISMDNGRQRYSVMQGQDSHSDKYIRISLSCAPCRAWQAQWRRPWTRCIFMSWWAPSPETTPSCVPRAAAKTPSPSWKKSEK